MLIKFDDQQLGWMAADRARAIAAGSGNPLMAAEASRSAQEGFSSLFTMSPAENCGLLLAELARRAPLLPGRDVLAFVVMDSMQRRVYGRKKQDAAFGHTKIRGNRATARLSSADVLIPGLRPVSALAAR